VQHDNYIWTRNFEHVNISLNCWKRQANFTGWDLPSSDPALQPNSAVDTNFTGWDLPLKPGLNPWLVDPALPPHTEADPALPPHTGQINQHLMLSRKTGHPNQPTRSQINTFGYYWAMQDGSNNMSAPNGRNCSVPDRAAGQCAWSHSTSVCNS
jgi:hypothetical protein